MRTSSAVGTNADRTCQVCHSTLRDPAEYHPHAICVLRRAGYSDEHIKAFVRDAGTYLNPNGTWRLVREGPRQEAPK